MNDHPKNLKRRNYLAGLIFAITGFALLTAPMQAATIFLTNNSTPKTLASNEGDAGTGLTNGTVNNGLDGDKTGDSTVLTLSADDGGGAITFNSISVSSGKSLFMNSSTMGHGNEKWGSGQNWTFTLDQTISFDALNFKNNENAYSLRSVAWKDDDSASGTGWSFTSDGTIGIFSLSSGQYYDFTNAGVSNVAAGTEIGFGAFGGANGGDLLYSFTITPVAVAPVAVRNWTGTGDWNSDPGNWTTTPPTSADIATISSGTVTIAKSDTGSASSVNVNSGAMLVVNGGLTADTVDVDGVLGGVGSITADVTIKAGGTLSTGNSPGTLTVGELTLADGANELWEFDGSSYDQTIVTNALSPFTGALTFDGTVNITLEPLSGALFSSDQVFTLFTFDSISGFTGGLSGAGTFNVTYGGILDKWDNQAAFFAQSGNTITLTGISYIPEPSTMLLAGLGLAGLMLRRRRALLKNVAKHAALLVIVAILPGVGSAGAAIILADELGDITVNGPANTSASIGGWDTVNGITAPSTTLTFQDGNDGLTILTLRDHVIDSDVPVGEVLPNINMTNGGWDTSINLNLDGAASIDLSSLVIDFRLAGSSGGDNSTSNKSGQVLAKLTGSSSGDLGTVDLGGNQSYPATVYTRTLDLTGLPTLNTSETYTVTIQARGTGWGHYKSLQAFEINGDISYIPEPSTMILAGLGLAGLTRRRKRSA